MSDPVIRAIPTLYRGIWFRSRLEAKWAAMFDQLDWHWEYEPMDLKGYIPDFLLHFHKPVIAEIKPATTIEKCRTFTPKLSAAGWDGDALIFGSLLDFNPFKSRFGPICCLYGQRNEEANDWDWQPGEMFRCGVCGVYSIVHDCGSFRSLACGHYDGRNHLRSVNKERIRSFWARSTNLVRFNPEGILV